MKIFLTISLLFILFSSNSQSNIEFDQFNNIFEPHIHKDNWAEQIKKSKNEVEFVFSLLFVIYKDVLSSQDIDTCVFTPSCSVYAIQTIKSKGIFIGLLDAFDRLSRCNPSIKDFPIDPTTHKYFDPVNSVDK